MRCDQGGPEDKTEAPRLFTALLPDRERVQDPDQPGILTTETASRTGLRKSGMGPRDEPEQPYAEPGKLADKVRVARQIRFDSCGAVRRASACHLSAGGCRVSVDMLHTSYRHCRGNGPAS
jgi:hypothetical protein